MSAWKYIVFDTPLNGDTIVIFPPMVPHDLMRDALVGPIVSAGFLSFEDRTRTFRCHGESTSLGIKSREVDSFYASRLLKGMFD